jgi:hypothetical protein
MTHPLMEEETFETRCYKAEGQVNILKTALADLLALPEAKRQLAYLDKGIGTKTEDAAWLRARDAMRGKQ